MLDVSKPTPLRLAGFLATAVGSSLTALAAVQTWVIATPPGDAGTDPVAGTDMLQGKVTALLGVAILVSILALRLMGSVERRRVVAIAILIGAVVATLTAFSASMNVRGRYFSDNVDKLSKEAADRRGIPIEEATALVTAEFDRANSGFQVVLQAWVWVGVAAGLVTVAGGLLDLAWVRKERLEWMGVESE